LNREGESRACFVRRAKKTLYGNSSKILPFLVVWMLWWRGQLPLAVPVPVAVAVPV